MAPPMSPQGSRAGLITAVVVLSILFVTASIFAFYYNAESRRLETSNKQLTGQNQQFASGEFQNSPAFQGVMAMRDTDPAFQGQSAAEILVAQRDAANRALAGTVDHAAAQTAYVSALNATSDKEVVEAGVTVGKNASLVDAVTQLTRGLKGMATQNQDLNEQLAAGKAALEQELGQRKVVLGERDEKLAELGKQYEEAQAQLAARGTAGDESVAKIQAETERAMKAAQAETSAQQKLVAERNATITKQAQQIEALTSKLDTIRASGTKEGVVRQADGEIVRVPGNDNVFINLGQGDGISPGLTFEVYDRFKNVPPLGDGTSDEEATLPKGKASIEVIRVGAGQSEARIVRQTLGQSVIERDIIANLVYDKNMKYNFMVFGDFDLDGNGLATPGDTEVIRDKIVKWGGKLQNVVNVNTDFVVLGKQPEVPVQDEEETATDIARREAAQKALDAYDDVRSQANALNIPILNQSRFLYYVGYFEQAQR